MQKHSHGPVSVQQVRRSLECLLGAKLQSPRFHCRMHVIEQTTCWGSMIFLESDVELHGPGMMHIFFLRHSPRHVLMLTLPSLTIIDPTPYICETIKAVMIASVA